jgi:hypothetical protein
MLQQVLSTLRQKQCNFPNCDTRTQASNQEVSRSLLGSQKQRTRVLLGYNYTWQHNAPLTMSCTMTTSHPSTSTLPQLCHAPRLLVTRSHRLYFKLTVCRQYSSPGHMGSTSTASHVKVPQLLTRLVVDYFAYTRVRVPRHVARLVVDYFAYTARSGASARRVARRRLVVDHFATSRGSSPTTSPRAGLSLTTSPMSRVRVPRHVARLVVDYFANAARPGASARRAAHCRLVIDYFTYATRPGASACRTAHRADRRRLLRLRRASGFLSMSRGSSSTTSPRRTARRRLLRLMRLVVDYFAYAARPGASARHAARHAARYRLLCAPATSSCGHTSYTSATPCVATSCLAETLALLRVSRAPL